MTIFKNKLASAIIVASLTTGLSCFATSAYAYKHVLLPADIVVLVPMNVFDPPMKPLGIKMNDLGGAVRNHKGAKDCWMFGGNVLFLPRGETSCWGKDPKPRAATVFPVKEIGDMWPTIPTNKVAARRLGQCFEQRAVSIGVRNNQMVCVDTPREVIAQPYDK